MTVTTHGDQDAASLRGRLVAELAPAVTAALLVWAFWSTLRSNLRAKRELDRIQQLQPQAD